MGEEWVSSQEIVRREFNVMRGRFLSAIESVGLPSGQERAMKTLVKHMSFQSQGVLEEVVNTLDKEGTQFRFGPQLETT